jgi:hypothetical protein
MAQAFDERRLERSGEAFPIAEDLSGAGIPQFSASTTGVLVFRSGPAIGSVTPITHLTWFDRTGKALGTVGEPGQYNTVALSPDGTRVAFSRGAPTGSVGRPRVDLWVHEFARNTSTQLTFSPSTNGLPVWSPDGSRIVYASNQDGVINLYQKDSSGAGNEDSLLKSGELKFPYDQSPDGRFLLYAIPYPKVALWLLPLTGDDHCCIFALTLTTPRRGSLRTVALLPTALTRLAIEKYMCSRSPWPQPASGRLAAAVSHSGGGTVRSYFTFPLIQNSWQWTWLRIPPSRPVLPKFFSQRPSGAARPLKMSPQMVKILV